MVGCRQLRMHALFPDDDLRARLNQLATREQEVSEARRALHVEIDSLRGELVRRLRERDVPVIPGEDFSGPESLGVREPRNPHPVQALTGSPCHTQKVPIPTNALECDTRRRQSIRSDSEVLLWPGAGPEQKPGAP